VTLFHGRHLDKDQLAHADALIVRSITKVSDSLLRDTPVKFVGTATIGTDHIDIGYLKDRNIGFAHAPGCNSNSVGEYWVAALLQLGQLWNYQFHGKTLGIIGYGNVGKNVEKKALALGLKVLKNDPPLEEEEPGKYHLVSLSQILQEADIISLHVPLTKTGKYPTFQMVDHNFMERTNKSIVLFNTCRGNVIREEAVMEARKQGKITHMILDVFPGEPGINPELVVQCEIATPHIAGYSLQGKLNGGSQILKSFCSFFNLKYPEDTPDPGPDNPLIDCSDLKGEEALFTCISRAYPIMKDDERLRASLNSRNPAGEFDLLRKNYPVRYEFPKYVAKLPDGDRELFSTIKKLGFTV
jgi:erythronate-4-phosphate dehydrogenase